MYLWRYRADVRRDTGGSWRSPNPVTHVNSYFLTNEGCFENAEFEIRDYWLVGQTALEVTFKYLELIDSDVQIACEMDKEES